MPLTLHPWAWDRTGATTLERFLRSPGDASFKSALVSSKIQPGRGFALEIMKIHPALPPLIGVILIPFVLLYSAPSSNNVTDLQRLQEIKKLTRATFLKRGKMEQAMLSRRGKRWVQLIGAFATTAVNIKIQKLKTSTTAIILLNQINMKLRDRVRFGDVDYFLEHLHWLDLAAGAALESVK